MGTENSTFALALTLIAGVGQRTAVALLRKYPDKNALLDATERELLEAFEPRAATAITRTRSVDLNDYMEQAARIIASHERAGIRVVALTDETYPELLMKIDDPPPLLFYKGTIDSFSGASNVAVIGTRAATQIGMKIAKQVAKSFARAGFTVVSGLAKGIDTAAHLGALEGGRTVAVLAGPLDQVYPAENRSLSERILNGGGALISEMALGAKTFRNSFVLRDRIQSGLSLAVIPVQTDVEGGTMHTVNFAEQQHRLLFCPKPLDSEAHWSQYAGIRMLLSTRRAQSFTADGYGEVIDQLRTQMGKRSTPAQLRTLPTEVPIGELSQEAQLPLLPEPVSEGTSSKPNQEHVDSEVVERFCNIARQLGLDRDPAFFKRVVEEVKRTLFPKSVKRKSTRKDKAASK